MAEVPAQEGFRVVIRQDMFLGGHRKWCADIKWNDGGEWRSWQYGHKTKRSLVKAIRAVTNAPITNS